MKSRGRVSAKSLEIVVNPLEVIERQRPPHDLTEEECEIWAAVVNSMPADWFIEASRPLLVQRCREVAAANKVAGMLNGPSLTIKDYLELLSAQRDQSRIIASLDTKLRISPQSTTNHRGNKQTISIQKKPWT